MANQVETRHLPFKMIMKIPDPYTNKNIKKHKTKSNLWGRGSYPPASTPEEVEPAERVEKNLVHSS